MGTFERVVFCYPFPSTNGDLGERKGLVAKFFQTVRDWSGFECQGKIILGLKSTKKAEDYQFDYWNVAEIANSLGLDVAATSRAMVPFWRATHVNGKPLDSTKHIFDDKSVFIKFYEFQMRSKMT